MFYYCDECKCKVIRPVKVRLDEDEWIKICPNCGNDVWLIYETSDVTKEFSKKI